MDDLAPEHLEVLTEDDEFFAGALTNYGSLFLGAWSTVAYSDKGMAGTNHVLPTAGGAKHSAGLSVSRFLKPLTWQRIEQPATPLVAHDVHVISASEGMAAHDATATMRLNTYQPQPVTVSAEASASQRARRTSESESWARTWNGSAMQ